MASNNSKGKINKKVLFYSLKSSIYILSFFNKKQKKSLSYKKNNHQTPCKNETPIIKLKIIKTFSPYKANEKK